MRAATACILPGPSCLPCSRVSLHALQGLLLRAHTISGGAAADAQVAKVVENANGSLNNLCVGSHDRRAALDAIPDLLPRLVQLLGGGSARATAAGVLRRLVESEEQAAACVSAGAAPALVAVLSRGDAPREMLEECCLLTGSLAALGQPAAPLAAGVAPHLQRLAGRAEPAVSGAAARALNVLPKTSSPAPESSTASATGSSRQIPRRTCAAPDCGATQGLRRCGGCGSVFYCSAACSRAHWRAHRAECRRLQAAQAAAPEGS